MNSIDFGYPLTVPLGQWIGMSFSYDILVTLTKLDQMYYYQIQSQISCLSVTNKISKA